MEITSMTQLIGSVGFPIAACFYMAYIQEKADTRHTEEINKLREALENNTKVMTKICAKLKIEEGDD